MLTLDWLTEPSTELVPLPLLAFEDPLLELLCTLPLDPLLLWPLVLAVLSPVLGNPLGELLAQAAAISRGAKAQVARMQRRALEGCIVNDLLKDGSGRG